MLSRHHNKKLETHFAQYRKGIIGQNQFFHSHNGRKRLVYADWTASGRLYGPIEKVLQKSVGPLVANTHNETSFMGTCMTQGYNEARDIIKKHVNADPDDILISAGSGMTGVMNKLQRMLVRGKREK